MKTICVYCASSSKCDPVYFDAADRLGKHLAQNKIHIIYGGGATGLMGRLADSALSAGGTVTGVLPNFMEEVEWGHKALTDLILVDDIHHRKRTLLEQSDAVVALPGGSGTLEELLEAITWKRLGLYTNPIAIVNTNSFYDPLQTLLKSCIEERFMNAHHIDLWTFVDTPEDALPALQSTAPGSGNAITSAAVQ